MSNTIADNLDYDLLDGLQDIELCTEELETILESDRQAKRELRRKRCGAKITTPNSTFCYQCSLVGTCEWCRSKLGNKWRGWIEQALDCRPVWRITMGAHEFKSFSRKYSKQQYLAIPQPDDWYLVLHSVEEKSSISIPIDRDSVSTINWTAIAGDKHSTGKRVSGKLGQLEPIDNGEVAFRSVGVGVVQSCGIPRTKTQSAIKSLQDNYSAQFDNVETIDQAEKLAIDFEADYVKAMDALEVPEGDRIILHVWGHVVLRVQSSENVNALNDMACQALIYQLSIRRP